MIQSTKGKFATNAVKGSFGESFPGDLAGDAHGAGCCGCRGGSALSTWKKLKGDRAGQHSVRINDQWRICFVWTPNGPADVEVLDDH